MRSFARGFAFCITLIAPMVFGGKTACAADPPIQHEAVTLSINPDGTATWNGEPVANEPALEARVAQRAALAPKLQLDLRFHSVTSLNESNRQTLLDLIEITARYGYVHVETYSNGARLTVLGKPVADGPEPR